MRTERLHPFMKRKELARSSLSKKSGKGCIGKEKRKLGKILASLTITCLRDLRGLNFSGKKSFDVAFFPVGPKVMDYSTLESEAL